ncbi:MAG: carbohydrate ABC transporter permease [Chloroflexi bacterium]|nr:carbohydrate ABC transporter permease [Anaerolineaceae bacterium]NMB90729.1 carbohydrate ABC transporter permease [Chloroflexota bacterium]
MNFRRHFASTLLSRGLVVLVLAVILVVTIFPLYWIAVTSLKTIPETYLWPPTFWPKELTFEGYSKVWTYSNFAKMFLNSVIVAVSSTVLSVVLASLAAYGFSRFKFKGHKIVLFFFLFTQMVPAILLLLPYFIMMRKLGLINSYTALILAYTSFSLPFCTWMLKGFFDSIPTDIDEAAMIDGCGRFQTLIEVILPLALPGIAATTLFGFLVAWNHYLFAMGLTTTPEMYTLPVGIAALNGEFRVAWNELMAGAIIASLPALVLYLLLQKWFVKGLTAGAVKG